MSCTAKHLTSRIEIYLLNACVKYELIHRFDVEFEKKKTCDSKLNAKKPTTTQKPHISPVSHK